MKKKMELIMAVIVLVGAYFLAKEGGAYIVESKKAEEGKICIVVDAGHGGMDPGKIGINKEKEKDINLKIAKKLKKLLEKDGIEVVMTRTDENGLYSESSNNKKVEDMRKTSSPTVIVECGFLSNSQEAALLATKEYQEKVAEAVHSGIVQYLHPEQEKQ